MAAAVAAAVVVAAGAAAAGAETEPPRTASAETVTQDTEEQTMNRTPASSAHQRSAAIALLLLSLIGARAAGAAQAGPKTFPSAEDAAQALAAAISSHDTKAILAVLGSAAQPLVSSGDQVADDQKRDHFQKSYEQGHALVAGDKGRMILQIGADNWPFPIPLEKTDAGWHFDVAAGEKEVLDRRIGANELAAIQACLAYVDAQREYYDRNPDGNALLHYAAKIASTAGKRNGLYWETNDEEAQSPLGAEFARARAEGYAGVGKGEPFHGYYFLILTAQGPAAAGGAYNYVAHGELIGGFGLVAYPAKWDNSGVMTFIVNQDGVVFEKDLGPHTAATAKAMKAFNPDTGWQRVEPPAAAAAKAP